MASSSRGSMAGEKRKKKQGFDRSQCCSAAIQPKMEVVVIIFSTESTSTIRSIVHVYFFKPVENLFYNKTY